MTGSFSNADLAVRSTFPLHVKSYIIDRMKNENMKIGQITGFLAVLVIGFLVVSGCTTSTPPAQPAQVTSPPALPNLTGTWTVHTQGASLMKTDTAGQWTHISGQYSPLTAQAIVTEQKDRVLHGIIKAPMGKDESFIGVIGVDNKTLLYADHDGTLEGQIVTNDLINVVYRQVTANDTVVGIGTWTRVK